MPNWTDKEVYDLLCAIDDGHRPTRIQRQMLLNKKTLNLSGIKITALPDSIGQLANLQVLNLSFTEITALPDFIAQLTNLQKLDLSYTKITALPDFIAQLTNLQKLDLRHTNITELPESIGQLVNLQTLVLGAIKITELPDSFGRLSNLEGLFLWDTSITRLPESIGQLSNLVFLGLRNIAIINLPGWIGELPNLRKLDLAGMTLDRIPKSLALHRLPFADIEFFDEDDRDCINLHNTTLTEQDRTVFLEHPELIESLYEDQITLKECRVLFLGDGGEGKTYTIRRLRNDCKKETAEAPFNTKETPGVEITDFPVEQDKNRFIIHFWDFGGQEILHSMHRCFLTDQTCYVVTVRTRDTDVTPRARYWLRNVTAFAPNSPILLYVNCWGNSDGKRSIDETGLRREFPMIRDIACCSAKEAEDTVFRKEFKDKLLELAASTERGLRTVNRRWDNLRKAITEESQTKNYLTKARYHDLCRENAIEDGSTNALLSYFNALGVCFSYHLDKNRNELEDYKLLNPVWLTNAIYAIIEEGVDYALEGRIKVGAIERMLGRRPQDKAARRTVPNLTYTKEECRYIIDVAAVHNLCYRIDAENLFFPALCPSNTPPEALAEPEGYPQHVEYLLKYTYLPDSVIHQLMVRCWKVNLTVSKCWLKGMLLSVMETHRAVVSMEDDENLRISIWSKPEHPAYELFELLHRELGEVNRSMNRKAQEFIVDGRDQYQLTGLISAAKDKATVYGPTTGKKTSAVELLSNLYDRWIIPWIKIIEENDEIMVNVPDMSRVVVPVEPRTFHPCKQSDPALRTALFEAYDRICPYCGNPIYKYRDMQVDHILPQKYDAPPGLNLYFDYLKKCGFDVKKPDYVENYFPAHGSCNRDKSNHAGSIPLVFWHEIAFKNAKKVLALMEEYNNAL